MTDEDKERDLTRPSAAASAAPPNGAAGAEPHAIREGGIAASPADPLGAVPIHETYGMRSGDAPEKGGTAADVADAAEGERAPTGKAGHGQRPGG